MISIDDYRSIARCNRKKDLLDIRSHEEAWKDAQVQLELAQNEHLPRKLFDALMESEKVLAQNEEIWKALLKNRSLPDDCLVTMIKRLQGVNSYYVSFMLDRQRLGAPLSNRALKVLATHQESTIRVAFADHEDTPTDSLALMWRDASRSVRYRVAKHPNASVDILMTMRDNEEDEIVLREVQKQIKLKV